MNEERPAEIVVKAYELGFVDLDEYECSSRFGTKLDDVLSTKPVSVVMDLRRCWLEYSNTSLLLDKALKSLLMNEANGRELIIKLNVNLGSAASLVSLLFQVSEILSCRVQDNPAEVTGRLNEFCVTNALSVAIQSYAYNALSDEAEPAVVYKFPS